MLYAIICEDVKNSLEKRLAARPAHLQRLQNLVAEDRLIIAGPHPAIDSEDPGASGFTGSLIIAKFSSLQDAEKWAAEDPYIAADVYAKTTIKPYKKVLP